MDRAELAPVKYDAMQKSGECFTHLTGIAIVIIAALAAAGMLDGVTAGGTIVGLASAMFIANCVTCVSKEQRPATMASACVRWMAHVVAIVIGSLAITGGMPLDTAGIVIAATVGAAMIIRCGIDCSPKSHSDWGQWARETVARMRSSQPTLVKVPAEGN